jgi:hypothetical protein
VLPAQGLGDVPALESANALHVRHILSHMQSKGAPPGGNSVKKETKRTIYEFLSGEEKNET